jgi:hypothetical protein
MSDICWDRYPHLIQSQQGQTWLTIQVNLGLAQSKQSMACVSNQCVHADSR